MRYDLAKNIQADNNGRRVLRWEVFSNMRDLQLLKALLKEENLQIDLNGIDIISHDGLIWVGFVCLYRSIKKLKTVMILPEDRDKVDYIRYLDFDSLQNVLNFSFANEYLLWSPQLKYKQRGEYALSLRRIHLVHEANWVSITNAASLEVPKFLTERFKISTTGQELFEYLQPFSGTIRELIWNVARHGGNAEYRGIGLVSYTPPPRRYNTLRFCCNDVGPGFKHVLSVRKGLTEIVTDKQAVIEALLFRFFREEQGIVGLFPTLKYIRRREGAISIRTGNILAYLDLSKEETTNAFDRGIANPNKSWLGNLVQFQERPFIPGSHIIVDLKVSPEVKTWSPL